MTDLRDFENLVASARRDQPPPLDVTQQVLSRLPQVDTPSPLKSPFVMISAASALAACLALAVTNPLWMAWRDPMVQVLISLGV